MNINPLTSEAYQLLHEGTLALARAERAGIRIDMDYIIKVKKKITRKIEGLEESFKETGFYKEWKKSLKGKTININSNPQLQTFLYKVKGIEIEKETTTGQGSTDDETLKQLNLPELDQILEIRKLKKIRDTYLEGFEREQVDGFIHPFFNLNNVRTYRSSSADPNFQNVPKRDKEAMEICRRALYPRIGHQIL